MLRTLRTIGVPVLLGLALSGACTFKDPNEGTDEGSGGSGAEGGRGGSSNPKAGSGSKAGSSAGKAPTGNAGQGGEAGAAPQCPSCETGFCLEDGTCVTCLPTNDQCPAGQYCTDANECAAGCKADGSSCASGSCNEDHNCENCINDDECVAPLVCGNGQCSAACTEAQEGTTTGCDNEIICCSLHCTELSTSSQHCGACGNACDAGQFCGLTTCPNGGEGGAGPTDPAGCVACHDTTLANICSIAEIIVILDTSKNPADGNRVTGRAIGDALAAQCMPTPILTEAEQDSIEALNLMTGRPVSGGGELLVVAGGPFYQIVEGYLEEQRIAPLYWYVDAGNTFSEFRKAADDEPVVTLPIAGDHDAHDFFIIQFMRDPESGSLVLNAQGMWLSGTVAAAYQITNGFLPDLAVLDKAWYAYEWTDMNGDLAPDLDEISLVDSGP